MVFSDSDRISSENEVVILTLNSNSPHKHDPLCTFLTN